MRATIASTASAAAAAGWDNNRVVFSPCLWLDDAFPSDDSCNMVDADAASGAR